MSGRERSEYESAHGALARCVMRGTLTPALAVVIEPPLPASSAGGPAAFPAPFSAADATLDAVGMRSSRRRRKERAACPPRRSKQMSTASTLCACGDTIDSGGTCVICDDAAEPGLTIRGDSIGVADGGWRPAGGRSQQRNLRSGRGDMA